MIDDHDQDKVAAQEVQAEIPAGWGDVGAIIDACLGHLLIRNQEKILSGFYINGTK